jgi:hypothetical protein
MTHLANLLEPYVPAEERQRQQNGQQPRHEGNHEHIPAMEIHDYMNTRIEQPISTSASTNSLASCASTVSVSLNDAVFDNITARLHTSRALTKDQILTRIHAWIDQKYLEPAQNRKAKESIDKGWNSHSITRISAVLNFLDETHPASLDTWMSGFIGESIIAYSSANSTSCSKGIDERIVTGLRGIDPQIDALFATPEKKEMVKRFFTSINIGNPVGAKFVARELNTRGITLRSTPEQAAAALRAFISEQIASHGLSAGGYESQIKTMAETLSDNYDALIKPQIEALSPVHTPRSASPELFDSSAAGGGEVSARAAFPVEAIAAPKPLTQREQQRKLQADAALKRIEDAKKH